MISIIICSRNKNIDKKVYKNIKDTIGTDFEIVWIDNSKNTYSMCSAYNEGVRRATGDFVCFMHEDVIFLSKDWGTRCLEVFTDSQIWMAGVIGCQYYDVVSPYWCNTGFEVGYNWVGNEKRIFGECRDKTDVVAIDGLWMFIRRDLFEKKLKWDESFKGFDMYDMDMSMQAITGGGKIVIIGNIKIRHDSNGNFSPSFYSHCQKFHEKWDSYLPVSSVQLSKINIQKSQRLFLRHYVSIHNELYYYEVSRLHQYVEKVIKFKNFIFNRFR